MAFADIAQIILFLVVLTAITPPLGNFMAKVFEGEHTWLHRPLGWLEKLAYRFSGIDGKQEMNWKTYAAGLMVFNLCGIFLLVLVQMVQAWLPLNPQNLPNVSWHSALNTAVSFVTNTNWQGYPSHLVGRGPSIMETGTFECYWGAYFT